MIDNGPCLYYNNDTQSYKDSCTGTNCSNEPTSLLKVKYVDNIGYFCQKCTKDLLESGLAEKIERR